MTYAVIDNLGDGTEFFVRYYHKNGETRDAGIYATREAALRAVGIEERTDADGCVYGVTRNGRGRMIEMAL